MALSMALLLGLSSCSAGSAKNHYILAEKLWNESKYPAAVSEFEKVISKDPRGKLGQQALFRAASTQSLFLAKYPEAVQKFKAYAEIAGDTPSAWEAERQIGDIFFLKLQHYEDAIVQYQGLITRKPVSPDVPEFKFRIAKSHFYLRHFDQALSAFRELKSKYPLSPWAEKAEFEIGVTAFTRGEQHPGGRGPGMEAYHEAMDDFQRFIRVHPESPLNVQSRFWIASCLEELDQLDAAQQAYEDLRKTYPSPNVIEIKLARIRERKSQRNH